MGYVKSTLLSIMMMMIMERKKINRMMIMEHKEMNRMMIMERKEMNRMMIMERKEMNRMMIMERKEIGELSNSRYLFIVTSDFCNYSLSARLTVNIIKHILPFHTTPSYQHLLCLLFVKCTCSTDTYLHVLIFHHLEIFFINQADNHPES